jgi:hypothetical protein
MVPGNVNNRKSDGKRSSLLAACRLGAVGHNMIYMDPCCPRALQSPSSVPPSRWAFVPRARKQKRPQCFAFKRNVPNVLFSLAQHRSSAKNRGIGMDVYQRAFALTWRVRCTLENVGRESGKGKTTPLRHLRHSKHLVAGA